jgi:hypothetical protein
MDGGMLIYTDKPGLTVADGDWSTLVAEVWPCPTAHNTSRTIYERGTEDNPPSQDVTLSTDGSGTATIKMSEADDKRAWVVRVHLLVGQTVVSASVDGKPVKTQEYKPNKADDGTLWQGYWPFGGEGSVPAGKAGNVVEFKMSASTSARKVEVVIGDGKNPAKKATASQAKSKAKLAPEPEKKANDMMVTADASVHVPWTGRPSTEAFATAGIASAGFLALVMLSVAAVRRLGASCQLAEAPIPEDSGAPLMEAA